MLKFRLMSTMSITLYLQELNHKKFISLTGFSNHDVYYCRIYNSKLKRKMSVKGKVNKYTMEDTC